MVGDFLRAEVSPEIMDIKPRSPDPEKVSLNSSEWRSLVPSIEVIDSKIMCTFFQDQINLCPLNGGVPKERIDDQLHCLLN